MLQLICSERFQLTRYSSKQNALPEYRYRRGLPRGLIALCAGFLLMESGSFAANDVSGVPQVIPAMPADQQIEALLLKAEQQISAGRTISPADDNAMTTWLRVLDRAFPASPGILRAFADFAARVRSRAADEKTAGKQIVSSDFQMFADLATKLLEGEGAAPASSSMSSQAATSQPVPEGHESPGLAASATGMVARSTPSSGALPHPALAPTLQVGEGATPASSPVISQVATSHPVPQDHTSPGPAASATSMAIRSTPSSGALPGPALAPTLPVGEAAAPASSSVNSQAATSQPVAESHTSPGLAASATGTATRSTASSGAVPRTALAPALAVLQEAGVGAAQTQMPLGNPATPDASPVPRVSNVDAARPAPLAGNTATVFAVPVARPATSVPTAQEQSMAALYASRGDEMLAIKDISAARKFYEYAANAGSARAATALARTHDPAFLTRLGAVGLTPDPVLAAAWYRKAAALGDPDADARLHSLSTEAAK